MAYHHDALFIVQVTDSDPEGASRRWFVGPYFIAQADRAADALESRVRLSCQHDERSAHDKRCGWRRTCSVEPLMSDDDCLAVADW